MLCKAKSIIFSLSELFFHLTVLRLEQKLNANTFLALSFQFLTVIAIYHRMSCLLTVPAASFNSSTLSNRPFDNGVN